MQALSIDQRGADLAGRQEEVSLRKIAFKISLAAYLVFLHPSPVRASNARVRIEGGADANGHVYEWSMINEGRSPIVHVKMNHHRATLFFGPEDWKVDCQNLLNVGVGTPWGECQAIAPAGGGIAPGRRGAFRMQCAPTGTTRGRGTVIVQFADGTEEVVDGVELPKPESTGDRYIPLLGLGVIAGVYAIIHAARRNRAKPS